jgi:hypothetical protein
MKKPKVLPSEKCVVRNYRSCYEPWEEGECLDTDCSFRKDGSFRFSYRVMLDRESQKGNKIFLTVSDTGIEKL